MKKRILLVDDHPVIRQGIRTILDGDYAICGEAANGQEAVEKAMELKPDLVLMDMSMPVMTGIEATRWIRQVVPEAKILIFSMHDFATDRSAGNRGRCRGIICKTGPLEALLSGIRRALT